MRLAFLILLCLTTPVLGAESDNPYEPFTPSLSPDSLSPLDQLRLVPIPDLAEVLSDLSLKKLHELEKEITDEGTQASTSEEQTLRKLIGRIHLHKATHPNYKTPSIILPFTFTLAGLASMATDPAPFDYGNATLAALLGSSIWIASEWRPHRLNSNAFRTSLIEELKARSFLIAQGFPQEAVLQTNIPLPPRGSIGRIFTRCRYLLSRLSR